MNVHVLRSLRNKIFCIYQTVLIGVLTFGASHTLLQAQTCAPPPSGLVSWWQAEGNPSDGVGGNNATIIGNVTYATGEVGQAFKLDGNHSGLTIGSPANLQLQNFTIDVWVKRGSASQASLDAGGGVVFGYGNGGYQLGIFDNGKLFLAKVGNAAVTSTVQVTDTAWHHVAVTKTGNTVAFYLDGVANPAPAFNTTFQFSAAVTIGTLQSGSLKNSFLGMIDELDVFDHALSATEVQGIYNAGAAGKCSGNTPPIITAQPANQTVIAGNPVSFNVTATGSQPLSYQWQLNGSNLTGATSATLNLVNVQTANAGNYSVIVGSPYGSTNSASALLTVIPAGVCVPAPSGLVSWWQGENNAKDLEGGNDGTVFANATNNTGSGNVTYASGKVGQAFSFDGNRGAVTVGNPVTLQLQDLTIDAWVKRSSVTQASLDTGGGVVFGYGGSGGYQFGMFDSGQMFFTAVGAAGPLVVSTIQVTDTGWHHVAVTKTGSSVVFYLDGVGQLAPAFNGTFSFINGPAAIGALVGLGPENTFLGMIDELDIFNRALSASEVQLIYDSVAGKCPSPPVIARQPTDRVTTVGSTASFSVTVTGAQPRSYQWQLNGISLAGATSPTLSLLNVQTANAGVYSVIISNPYGSTNSANALLTVNPTAPCTPPPSGLVGWWPAEGNGLDIAGGNNATAAGSVAYAPGEVGQAFSLNGNKDGLTVGNPLSLQLQNFTIDAWIKRGSTIQASLDIGGGMVFGYGGGGYQLGLFDNGQLFLSQAFGPSLPAISTLQVADTGWHHVAAAKNGSTVVFYLDGVANSVSAFSAAFQFTTDATIGALPNGFGVQNSFLGLIDELDVFGRALSSTEINAIYVAGSSGKCPGAPVITTQPLSQTSVVGGSASLSVTATGFQPLTYQWQLNGTNVTGATSATLNLAKVKVTDAGNYSVVINNPGGSVTSANALLTVNPAPGCAPPPPGLVSWWPGEGNASDIAGGNNGTIGGNVTYTPGEVGQAFSLDGNHSGVTVGNAPNLQLQDFTIDAWIKRGSATKASLDTGGGVVFGYGTGGYQFAVSDIGQLFLDQVGTPGQVVNSTAVLTDTAWHHVAVTKNSLTVVFYVDGVAYPAGAMSVLFGFTTSPTIGASGSAFQNSFLGSLDEVDVFSRALSASEVARIYNAVDSGKCPNPPVIATQPAGQTAVAGGTASFSVSATGSLPLSYQWQLNGTNVTGATSATLNLVDVQNANAGNYSVIVSNPYGSTNSANALLTVNPLTCTPAPSGLVSWWQGEGNATDFAGDNNGTIGGNVTYAPGKVGQAFSLDGNHSGVTVGNDANLQLQDFTIDAWVKRGSATKASLDTGGGVVFGYGSGGYQFAISDNGQMFLDQVGVPGQIVASTVQVTDTAWHHVALTKSGLVVNFYLDGVLSPGPAMSVAFAFGTSPTIGAQGAGFQNSFLGSLDEVDVFNRALSASEVLGIYNASTAGKCPSPPVIVTQPVNQVTVVGNSASFSVTASGSQPLSYQWQLNGTNLTGATSATLNLVSAQTADAGNYSVIVSNPFGSTNSASALLTVNPATCTPAPSGLVSWWQGEGNPNDIAGGNNGTVSGNVTYAPGKVGQAFSLDGNHSGVTVGNAANLQLQDFTIDAWIKRGSATKASLDTGGGVVFGYGSGGYQFAISDTGQMFLDQVGVPGQIVASTVQVTDTAWHHVALTKSGLVVNFYLDGVLSPGPAMSVAFAFGTSPTIGAQGAGFQNSFLGSLDEVDVFNRALSASEVLGIYNASIAGKCGLPPLIVTQPSSQAVFVGTNVIFTVTAGGTPPLSYQWTFGGTNISGATNSSLTLTNVQLNQAGSYAVVVANAITSITSSPATLTVTLPPSQIQIANVTHAPGIITVPVNIIARGDENALGFSINYDKSVLTFAKAVIGSGAGGVSMLVNTNLTGSGQLGIALSQPFNTSFTHGAHELAKISFTTAPVTKTTVTAITFGDQPIVRQVSNPQAAILPATYTDGGITITFPGYEADVSPRPNGDNALTIVDWVQVGRFVAGLDTISSPSEFQRADCAPRSTLGNGTLTVADWVQAGRYVAGLDPLTYAGGPTTPTPMSLTGTGNSKQAIGKDSLSRTLTVVNSAAQAGKACQVPIQLAARGNENGLEFSVVFDPAALSFTGATVGDGATGANLFVNTGQAASGKVGVLLALPPGSHFAASTLQVAKLNFMAAPSAGGSSPVSFTAQPLPQQTVDTTASDLPITYINGVVTITAQAVPNPILTASYANGGIILSWPASAAGFNLESNPHPGTPNWSNAASSLFTNAATITTTNPVAGLQMFFRLHHP